MALIAIAAFFYAFVWPIVKNNLESQTKCAAAQCNCAPGTSCECTYYVTATTTEMVRCTVKDTATT